MAQKIDVCPLPCRIYTLVNIPSSRENSWAVSKLLEVGTLVIKLQLSGRASLESDLILLLERAVTFLSQLLLIRRLLIRN
jgi:hypothetical protein